MGERGAHISYTHLTFPLTSPQYRVDYRPHLRVYQVPTTSCTGS